MHVARFLSLLSLLFTGSVALAALPARDVARFDKFARAAGPFCAQASSQRCFERAFVFADMNKDGGLSLEELEDIRLTTLDWTRVNREKLDANDRRGVLATLAVIEVAGLPNLFASYDRDGNGRLDRSELQADVKLDDRPLPVVFRDPEAIDWASLRDRLGAAALLLDGVLPR